MTTRLRLNYAYGIRLEITYLARPSHAEVHNEIISSFPILVVRHVLKSTSPYPTVRSIPYIATGSTGVEVSKPLSPDPEVNPGTHGRLYIYIYLACKSSLRLETVPAVTVDIDHKSTHTYIHIVRRRVPAYCISRTKV